MVRRAAPTAPCESPPRGVKDKANEGIAAQLAQRTGFSLPPLLLLLLAFDTPLCRRCPPPSLSPSSLSLLLSPSSSPLPSTSTTTPLSYPLETKATCRRHRPLCRRCPPPSSSPSSSPLPSSSLSYPVSPLPIAPSPLLSLLPIAIVVVVTIMVNFVARSAAAIVVVVTRRHCRCHRIPLRRHPSCHRLSITFAAPVDGWLLRSLPAQQHTN
jgi:hypothetical protein